MNTNPITTNSCDAANLPDGVIGTIKLSLRTRRAINYVLGACPDYLRSSDAVRVIAADLTAFRNVGVTSAERIRNELVDRMAAANTDLHWATDVLREFRGRGLSLAATDLSESTVEIIETALGNRPEELTAILVAIVITEFTSAEIGTVRGQQQAATIELVAAMTTTISIADRPGENVDSLISSIVAARQLPGAAAARFGIDESFLRDLVADRQSRDAVQLHRVWLANDLAVSGLSLRQIAAQLDITGERVRQLLDRFGVNVRDLKAERNRAAAQGLQEQQRLVTDIVRNFPGVTVDELELLVPVSSQDLQRMVRPVRHLVFDGVDAAGDLAGRQARVITALQAAAVIETPLSGTRYDQLVTSGVIDGPGRQTAAIVFGTWRKACAAAGVSSLEPRRDRYERVWDDDNIIQTLACFLTDESANGTVDAYEIWRSGYGGPSAALIRLRYNGLWTEACSEALQALRHDWDHGATAGDMAHVVAALCGDPDADFGNPITMEQMAA